MGRVKRFQHVWYVYGCGIVQHRHLEVGRIEGGDDGLHVFPLATGSVQPDAVWGCLGSLEGE